MQTTNQPSNESVESSQSTSSVPLVALKVASARKAGNRSDGSLRYAVLADRSLTQVYLSIVSNEGAGQFSKEVISFDALMLLMAKQVEQEFPAKVLQAVFKSKSRNNAGFLMAALLAEQLMTRVEDKQFAYRQSGDWLAWQSAILALPPLSDDGVNPIHSVAESSPSVVEVVDQSIISASAVDMEMDDEEEEEDLEASEASEDSLEVSNHRSSKGKRS